MDIILVHLGPTIPPYIYTCISQIRKFTQDRIIIAVDHFIQCPKEENVDIIITALDNEHISKFFDPMMMNGFWKYAALRLYIVELIMKQYHLEQALHIENDNLIYDDPNNTIMKQYVGDKIGLTRITDSLLSAGIMHVGDICALSELTRHMTEMIKSGKQNLEKMYGSEMFNEMRLLDIISQEDDDLIKIFDSTPTPNASHLFDCASWGQWVGGTHQTPGIPHAEDRHLIGREILQGKYIVMWENNLPYVLDLHTREKTKLFNLHIHSKDLERWKS